MPKRYYFSHCQEVKGFAQTILIIFYFLYFFLSNAECEWVVVVCGTCFCCRRRCESTDVPFLSSPPTFATAAAMDAFFKFFIRISEQIE